MIQFRDYQSAAIESIFTYFEQKDGNPIVAMPTGTGKSVVIAGFLRAVFKAYPKQRIIKLTHVKELIQQNFEKLVTLWPTAPAGIYSASLNRRDIAPITYAGIASVHKLAGSFGRIDLVLIDECHLVGTKEASMYNSFLSQLREINPKLKVVGFTATPYRLGLGNLIDGGVFTDVCFDITTRDSFNRLIAEGYLAPLIPKATKQQLDVSGVAMSGGEFVASSLQAAVDKEAITYAALTEVMRHRDNRHSWLVFTTGVEHTENVARMLKDEFDVDAAPVHSKLSSDERDSAIVRYKAGDLTCLVNNNILTTGFDHPHIDLIVVLRPTNSSVLWVQMLGRGTRPAEGKRDCLVLDFADNTRRLGPINDPVLPRKKGGKGGGQAPVKICEVCDTYNHASATFCISCGHEFHRAVKFGTDASTRDLIVGDIVKPEHVDFKVDRVNYSLHMKAGKPPTVRVSYFCGLQLFHEWVCFEHTGFPLHKAHHWWRQRFLPTLNDPSVRWVPDDCATALTYASYLRVPTRVRVWVNRKHPEIISYDYV